MGGADRERLGDGMRKVLLLVGSLSLFGSLLVFGPGGTAWAAVPATGSAACKFVPGTGTFSPPLTPAGTATVKVVKFHFTVTTYSSCGSSVTSPAGDTVTGVTTVVGSGSYKLTTGFANSCANFALADIVNKLKVKVSWIATPTAIAPTVATYVGNIGSVSPGFGGDLVTLNAPVAKTGSFASTPTVGTTSVQTDVPASCTTAVPTFLVKGNYVSM
jgi:hypothetical protein